MSEDAFEDFLAAASHAVGTTTVYASLSDDEKAAIDNAVARLDRGEGIPYADLKARLDEKLKAAGQ